MKNRFNLKKFLSIYNKNQIDKKLTGTIENSFKNTYVWFHEKFEVSTVLKHLKKFFVKL